MTVEPVPESLARRIERLLPQTQCAACGYPGCQPFAAALAEGEAAIDGCAPGGQPLTRRLQRMLGKAPYAPGNALTQTIMPAPLRAGIREQDCIGCTKCIEPCPVDAVLGAPKQLHSILSDACTGCGLCLPPCPVDCIELEPAPLDFLWPDPSTPAAVAIREGVDIVACTACGDCARACPSTLAPAALASALAAVDLDAAATLGLDRCTLCGHCSEVCLERIPLADYFRHGKAIARAVDWQSAQAASASRHQRKRQARQQPAASPATPDYVARPVATQDARQEIAAALARTRKRLSGSGAG